MSDGEDDFMCEEEEDYGLVSFPAETHRNRHFIERFFRPHSKIIISRALAYGI